MRIIVKRFVKILFLNRDIFDSNQLHSQVVEIGNKNGVYKFEGI